MSSKCKILIVDKKNNYPDLFRGFRKHKFSFDTTTSVLRSTENALLETDIFFIVLYEPKDIIQLVKLSGFSKSIIVGTANKRLFTSFKTIKEYPIVDMTLGVHLIPSLQEALNRFY